MGLIRLLTFIAVIAIIYFLIKRWLNKPSPENRRVEHDGNMVRCAQCGTFVPDQQAVHAEGKAYCSQAHLELSRRS